MFLADVVFRFFGVFGLCRFSFFVSAPKTMNSAWTNISAYPEFNEEFEFHSGFAQKLDFYDFPAQVLFGIFLAVVSPFYNLKTNIQSMENMYKTYISICKML